MKRLRWINLVFLIVLLSACGRGTPTSAGLPTAFIQTTRPPDAEAAMKAYLQAMVAEDYTSMYAMLDQAEPDEHQRRCLCQTYQGRPGRDERR